MLHAKKNSLILILTSFLMVNSLAMNAHISEDHPKLRPYSIDPEKCMSMLTGALTYQHINTVLPQDVSIALRQQVEILQKSSRDFSMKLLVEKEKDHLAIASMATCVQNIFTIIKTHKDILAGL
jgi:hypothetical protein